MDVHFHWSMYFSSVVAMQHHPGCKNPKDLDECARIADEMVLCLLDRQKGLRALREALCPGS